MPTSMSTTTRATTFTRSLNEAVSRTPWRCSSGHGEIRPHGNRHLLGVRATDSVRSVQRVPTSYYQEGPLEVRGRRASVVLVGLDECQRASGEVWRHHLG